MNFAGHDVIDRIRFAGVKTFCPICRSKDEGFLSLPDIYRVSSETFGYEHFGKGEMTSLETYSCAACGASDRERLYACWLQAYYKGPTVVRKKMIHFAPESALSSYIVRSKMFSEYETADLMMEGVSHQVDLTNLSFMDNSYDFFVCSHVLEHVADDLAAIKELFRITRTGGCGILMAPIIIGLSQTLENRLVVDPAERWRLFGQQDHVRLYSHDDYVARIRSQGFRVEQLDQKYFGLWRFKLLGLKASSILYVVRK